MTDTTEHQVILSNRAHLSDVNAQTPDTDALIFRMKDQHHEFSLGLQTVLKCLSIAEEEGYVPALAPGWWAQLQLRYEQLFRS